MLHDARREARMTADDHAIPLPEQDRTRWNHDAIAQASELLLRALSLSRPGPLQIEAAISATHCRAHNGADTDWKELAALYALLEEQRPIAAVRVNRAFALARAEGPRAGLALLEQRDAIDPNDYPYVHLVRGTLLAELESFDKGCCLGSRCWASRATSSTASRPEAAGAGSSEKALRRGRLNPKFARSGVRPPLSEACFDVGASGARRRACALIESKRARRRVI